MRCPRCEAENPDDARRCSACAKPFRRRPTGPEADEALTPEAEAFFRRARWVYFWALWSMLPPVGVLLGPVAALMALSLRRERKPDWPGGPTLVFSIWLGLMSSLTQAAGAWLVWSSW